MKNSIKENLNNLHLSDIYSLMLFILYKVQDIPEYTVLSELCYLLDGSNTTRLLTYFAGKTVTFPSEKEMVVLSSSLLLYKYINMDGNTLPEALAKIPDLTQKQQDESIALYLKILPIMRQYNIDRSQLKTYGN